MVKSSELSEALHARLACTGGEFFDEFPTECATLLVETEKRSWLVGLEECCREFAVSQRHPCQLVAIRD